MSGVAILALGLVGAILLLDKSAYRFAGVTLSIVMLVERGRPPHLIAVHRFVEVSLGIAVALALAALRSGHEVPSDESSLQMDESQYEDFSNVPKLRTVPFGLR